MTSAVGGYAFGDSAPAARRLGLLADVFEPPSRAFLAEFARVAGDPVDLAVDLGCGPGHSTQLVASVVGARRTLGLDQSGSFVALAEAGAPPGVEFAVHDVTVVPFPSPPAGLVYGRFLLSHLPDPPATLAAWATQLAPGRAAAGRRGRPDPHHPAGAARLPGHGGRPARRPRPQPGDRR